MSSINPSKSRKPLETTYSTSIQLIILEFIAIYTIWIQLFYNGSWELFQDLRSLEPEKSVCPRIYLARDVSAGGDGLLGKFWDFTAGLICAWSGMVSGADAGLSIFAFMFCGTLAAFIILIWVEGLKEEWKGSWIGRPTVWLFGINTIGFGPTMPLYCLLHQCSTPKPRKAASAETLLQLKVLPYSVVIGYGLPSLLQCLPSLSPSYHRLAIGVWSIYPLIIAGAQSLLVSLFTSPNNDSKFKMEPTFLILKSTYLFGIRCSALCYIWTMSIIITCLMFPSLFADLTVVSVSSFAGFWLPGWPAGLPFGVDGKIVGTLSESFHELLRWDMLTASWATCIWALSSTWNAREKQGGYVPSDYWGDCGKMHLIIVCLGWGSAAVAGAMDKDEVLFSGFGEETEGLKAKKN